jgi:hypothetical protein
MMELDNIVQELPYHKLMTRELVERWADGIPVMSENDPDNPEWPESPIIYADLSQDRAGEVLIKNEADTRCNPTGTCKDRPAWECVCLYRDSARALEMRRLNGELRRGIEMEPVPRITIITSGNMGHALAHAFKQYNLPPPKLIFPRTTSENIIQFFRGVRADVYIADLDDHALKPHEIMQIANHEHGVELTSAMSIEPQAIFYDWLAHQCFNVNPDRIYTARGSARLMENLITWQYRTMRNDAVGRRDPRLKVPVWRVISMDVIGAVPTNRRSLATMLNASFNPFVIFEEQDISALVSLSCTGSSTGLCYVSDERILQAYEIMNRYCETSYNGAASMAAYLEQRDEGRIRPDERVLIINTGKGF